jgi:hypothetical protein
LISFSASEVGGYYLLRVPDLRQRRKRWRGRCPIHCGEGASFSVDSETGLWRCWSQCGRGDIIELEIALTGATWRDAVSEIERIIGRVLLNRPASVTERRALAERREREQQETRDAEFFRTAAASVAEHILNELPEAVPERFGPTQLLLDLRAARGAALLAIYRDFRGREPQLAAALVYVGGRAWQRLGTRLARFIVAGAEVPRVA